MNLGLGGTGHKCVATVTCYRRLIILRMDSFFHRYRYSFLSLPIYATRVNLLLKESVSFNFSSLILQKSVIDRQLLHCSIGFSAMQAFFYIIYMNFIFLTMFTNS